MNNENGRWRNVVLARCHNWIFVPSSASAQFLNRHSAHYIQERLMKLQNIYVVDCKIIKRMSGVRETSFLLLSLTHLQLSLIKRTRFEAAFLLIFSRHKKNCSELNSHQRRSIIERALCCCGHLINGGSSFALTQKVRRRQHTEPLW